MSFLAPWWIPAIVAGLAVPTLLLFYFLRLKREEAPISSTLLWKQTIQDLQVNSPFQRLRNNLLLWLQLLALLIAALCLWQPVMRWAKTEESTTILLMDQSASMATVEADGRTRLDHAKEQARTHIDNLDEASKAMIIAFSDRARVVAPFTTDKASLAQQIDNLEQTTCASRLGEAIELAETYGTRQIISLAGGKDLPAVAPTDPADLMLFSDGRIEDADDVVLRRGNMRLCRIGTTSDNVGIIRLMARRNFDRPEQLSIFAQVANYGPKPVTTDLELRLDGRTETVTEVKLAGAPQADGAPTTGPGATNALPSLEEAGAVRRISFDVSYDKGGVVELLLPRRDALDADNRAWLVVEPPRRLDVLLVSSGKNYFLRHALSSAVPRTCDIIEPEVFESRRAELAPDGRMRYDVVVMDRYSPDDLPQGNYLFFGSAPKVNGVSEAGEVKGQYIYDWDEQHPVLRYVVLNYLRVAKWLRLELPDHAVPLVEGEDSAVVAALSMKDSRFLIVAFDLYDSNWPLQETFPVFMRNAVRYLAESITGGPAQSVSPGTALAIPIPAGADRIAISRPDGKTDRIDAEDRATAYYPNTQRPGVYRVEPSEEGYEAFAVNLLNPVESNVRPHDSFHVGAEQVVAGTSIRRENKPLWPWLLLAGLVVLLLEWLVYNRRMFV